MRAFSLEKSLAHFIKLGKMMDYLIVCAAALVASGLTFFSGFGLGTILMPVLALFFPVPVAVAATALVHFANNLFKLALVGPTADRSVLMRFAIPAVIGALAGAWALSSISFLPVIYAYHFWGNTYEVSVVKLLIGMIIIVFSCLEIFPNFSKMAIDKKFMPWGGLLSGFFGGLSGNQGALRSIFLLKAGLSKEGFIGTGVAAAVMVDFARLLIYGLGVFTVNFSVVSEMKGLILAATASAFAGAFLGREVLKKVTLKTVQLIVAVLLVILGIALSAGLI